MNTLTVPLDWLKSIPQDLMQMDEIPLLGSPPAFSWENFSRSLSKLFEVDNFHIEPGEYQWRSKENLLDGFADPSILCLSITPLEGRLFWAIDDADISYIMSVLLTRNEPLNTQFIDNEFKKGFVDFLAAEVIYHFQRIFPDKTLFPHLKSEHSVPEENSFCLDIKTSLLGKTFWGRLILSEEFRQAWKKHFTQNKMNLSLPNHLAEQIQLPIHLEAGSVSLQASDCLHIHPGDFIILDNCSVEPGKGGRVVLTVNGQSLFHAQLKNGSLEIVEKPLYEAGDADMGKNDSENEDFSEQEDDHDMEESDFDESDFDEDEFEQEEDEFEKEFEEEPTLEELLKKPEKNREEKPKEEKEKEPQHVASFEEKEKKTALSPEEISVKIKIEIGQVNMSIQQLLQLQPGNLLELNSTSHDTVNLVINGKCIGKGELLRIGETLGVRIVDLL